eukprot:125911-Rhodomonas_salina.1
MEKGGGDANLHGFGEVGEEEADGGDFVALGAHAHQPLDHLLLVQRWAVKARTRKKEEKKKKEEKEKEKRRKTR